MEATGSQTRVWNGCTGWSRAGLLVALVLLASACAPTGGNGSVDVDSSAESGEILARIGEVEISRAQVEEALASELLDLDQKRYQLIEQGLGAVINDELVEIAAEAAGLPVDEFLRTEIDDKIQPVTQLEIDRFYEQRKDQIPQSKEEVAPQIRRYLEQTRKQGLFAKMVDELRAEHEPEILLDPMRIEVSEADSPAKGPESAPVTIVEFSDFQCPFCSKIIPTLDRVTKDYADTVRLVFRQFPLHSLHPEAQKAAEASLCAHEQGEFWAMHDAMFEDQEALGLADLKATAKTLGLDSTTFDDCLDSGKHADQVEADLEAGLAAGVSGTPALFINGRFLSGAQAYDEIAKVIDDELLRAGN